MANRINDWQGLLELANKELRKENEVINVAPNDDGYFDVSILTIAQDGTLLRADDFASNYMEDELGECVNDAWAHVRAKVMAEKPKVWLVKQLSNVDGQMLFNVVPCMSLEKARQVLQEQINTLMTEGHYTDYKEWPNDFTIEQTDDHYFINDNCDDYYEKITIEEKGII